MPIRVLIADDHAIVRLGVRKLNELLGGGEIAVAGEVGDGDGLLDAVEALSPDVLLLDIVMPGLDVIEDTLTTRLSLARTSVASFARSGFSIACMEAIGSTAETSTPPACSCTMTLQGSIVPTLSSSCKAR